MQKVNHFLHLGRYVYLYVLSNNICLIEIVGKWMKNSNNMMKTKRFLKTQTKGL